MAAEPVHFRHAEGFTGLTARVSALGASDAYADSGAMAVAEETVRKGVYVFTVIDGDALTGLHLVTIYDGASIFEQFFVVLTNTTAIAEAGDFAQAVLGGLAAGVQLGETLRRIGAHYHQISNAGNNPETATDYAGNTIDHSGSGGDFTTVYN